MFENVPVVVVLEVQSQYPDSAKVSHAPETTASTAAAELLKHRLRRGTAAL